MGTRGSQIRRPSITPLDKHVEASKNLMTWMDIKMLRERKKVVGWSIPAWIVMDLTAMAILKQFSTPGLVKFKEAWRAGERGSR